MKTFKKLLFAIIIVALIDNGLYLYYSQAHHENDRTMDIHIPAGASSQSIANILEEQNIISSSFYFTRYLERNELSSTMKAGKHSIPKNYTYQVLASALQKSPKAQDEVKITFTEGKTIEQIIEKAKTKLPHLDREAFLRCLQDCPLKSYDFLPENRSQNWRHMEGYLFPNTYLFQPKASERDVITKMIGSFEQKIYANKEKAPLHRYVIMASLIEKESRKPSERRIISGIIHKRLEQNMVLGIDATTRYAKGDWTGDLIKKDFEHKNEYNTRRTQ